MKLDVYKCDICSKEHRRAVVTDIHLVRDGSCSSEDILSDICSLCEEEFMRLIKERRPINGLSGGS